MKIRQLILSTAAMMILGTGCVVEVSDRSAYESCSAGQACGGGTICQAAAISTNGGAANFCTVSCGAGGFVCPAFGSGSAYAPTCINSSTGIAQCYDTCASDFDCGVGTACRPVVGVPNQVCLPIGGAPINNPVPPAVWGATAGAGVGGGCLGCGSSGPRSPSSPSAWSPPSCTVSLRQTTQPTVSGACA